jgi:hypothetical protein
MPNFRLSETQAVAAVLLGVLGLISLAMLSVVVLYHFNKQTWTILYSSTSTWGRYRPSLVYLFTAATLLLGCVAVALGFSSLGQKRNAKQAHSFLGMAIGGIAIALAPVFLTMWMQRAEEIIQKIQ